MDILWFLFWLAVFLGAAIFAVWWFEKRLRRRLKRSRKKRRRI